MGRTNNRSIGLCEKNIIAYSSVCLLVAVRSILHKSVGKEIILQETADDVAKLFDASDKSVLNSNNLKRTFTTSNSLFVFIPYHYADV